MRSLGVWLMIFAVGSYLLPVLTGLQFFVVAWIGMWGSTVAWIIRAAMFAIGLALVVVGSMRGRIGQPRHE